MRNGLCDDHRHRCSKKQSPGAGKRSDHIPHGTLPACILIQQKLLKCTQQSLFHLDRDVGLLVHFQQFHTAIKLIVSGPIDS